MTVLLTARLVLRPKHASDGSALHRIASDWQVVRWTASWPWPPDPALTEQRLSGGQPAQGLFATIIRDDVTIGMASVAEGVLGGMLARSAWGRGYATEACKALLDFAFGTTDQREARAGVFMGNDPSLRVLAKLGFRETGRSRGHCRVLDSELNGVELALTPEDWLARPPPA